MSDKLGDWPEDGQPCSEPTPADLVDVTIVVPLLNEAQNVVPLYHELCEVIDQEPLRYEILFIDDGSRDRTAELLRNAVGDDPRVRIIEFTRRFGQTAGLSAGFRMARGRVVVPIDGDRQNDPHDIPRLVAKLDEPPGWDIVSGWRKNRQDKLLSRKLPSHIANKLVRKLTWTGEVHDFGCSLKAYRREVLDDVRLYGEMHRFLPAICKWRGATITEMEVNHRARIAGESKYGLKRTIKVILDLLTIKFLGDYLTKPLYFFGKWALVALAVSIAAVTLAFVQKLGYLTEHGERVMLNENVFILFAMMTVLVSIMLLMMGVLSELMVRIYHESQELTPYKIRRITRGGSRPKRSSPDPRSTPESRE
ncbi:MAG: glycosyltransferase family 2 protein [Phycisphaeraceae bacterium]